jgi:S1-C subfamily serine protease
MKHRIVAFLLVFCGRAGVAPAQESFTAVAEQVNKKMVKVFGAGGFKGLPSYGTGILVSPEGHILTVNNHILSTADLRVHLYDGRVYHNCKVLFQEPELDIALLKIDAKIELLPYFDFAAEAKKPQATPGDWVLAFSNCFQIATRDEPMSVQKGVIAALTDLRGRRGVFDAPYAGEAYFIDIVANNPGAAGGIITNRKGDLLGILGRELKNSLTDTWINYAVPIHAKVDIVRDEKKTTVDMALFVKEGMEGKYREGKKLKREKSGAYHGIVLVHNAVSATPAFIEEVLPDSPAAKAGLRPDDLIVYIDGELVSTIKVFKEIMGQVPVGEKVRLEVQRGNRLQTVMLELTEAPKLKASK